MNMVKDRLADKIRGTLFGVACGDALGATLEFKSYETIHATYRDDPRGLVNIVGGGPFGWAKGQVTDDTDMTMGVANGMLDASKAHDLGLESIVSNVGRYFIKWYEGHPKDVGGTTSQALRTFQSTKNWDETSRRILASLGDRSAGNGSLMRSAPVSLLWRDHPGRLFATSAAIAAMTHPATMSQQACGFYNLIVARLLEGNGKDDAASTALDQLAVIIDSPEWLARWIGATILAKRDNPPMHSPSGYVWDTFLAAMWAVYSAPNAEEAIIRAANLGGDTDSTGAVAGGMAGALWGFDALPKRWIDTLQEKTRDELHRLADEFITLQ